MANGHRLLQSRAGRSYPMRHSKAGPNPTDQDLNGMGLVWAPLCWVDSQDSLESLPARASHQHQPAPSSVWAAFFWPQGGVRACLRGSGHSCPRFAHVASSSQTTTVGDRELGSMAWGNRRTPRILVTIGACLTAFPSCAASLVPMQCNQTHRRAAECRVGKVSLGGCGLWAK